MTKYFVAGNVWLLMSLVLFVGKRMDGYDTYSLFGIGGQYSSFTYWLAILACAAGGIRLLLIARHNRDING